MVSPQRRASSASPASSSSESSASESSHSSVSTACDVDIKNVVVQPNPVPVGPRAWRFLDTEETCHFFNTEIVIGTNDVRQVDLDDLSDESESEGDDLGEPDAEAPLETHEPVGHDEGEQLVDPMQTTYDGIYSEFDDLYLPGISTNAPRKIRGRRSSQRREAATALSAFSKELRIGQSYLCRKRSEFLRVCFQRALELNKDHDTQETAETVRSPSLGSPPRGQTAFQFQCSRLERPIDISTPELYPRKWPHLPYRNPYDWRNDPAAIVTFAQRVTDLPEGSLLYELIDVHEFTERCCELLKEEGVDVWSTESRRDTELSEIATAILVAMLSVAVRLQSFSLLLLAAELLVQVSKSSVFSARRWGSELAAVVGDCMKTLQAFLQTPVPPVTYPRALVSQWKVCAYQPSTSDAIATDGLYLYIYGRSGLLKVGTGRGSTLRDFVYEHNKSYRRSKDAERSWLCLIGDYLYCRSIVMPSGRVDRIHTGNLRAVDELVLAPSSKESEAVSASSTVYAMVTDGTDLLTIHSIDTHAVGGTKKSRSSKAKKTSSSQAAKDLTAKAPGTSSAGATSDSSGGIQIGDRVIRGPDWKWGAQDGEKGSPGTVERISTWGGVKGCGVTVRWDKNQRINTYRWGAEGCYDIVVVVEKAGGLEKKPLPDKSTSSVATNESITPRHRFAVTRFGVANLLCVMDLEREAAHSFLGLRPKAEVGVSKPPGDTDSLLTAVHEHTLGLSSATTAWMCDGSTSGCLGDNSGVRYRCEQGCDFDLCDVCLADTLIGKQLDPQKSADPLTPDAPIAACDDKPSEQKPSKEQSTSEEAPIPVEVECDALSTEEREAAQLDDLVTFWCGLFSRRECEIALQRAAYSSEDAVTWLSDCGFELRKRVILPSTNSFTLESPPNSSGLDPVLLVAGSFYAIDSQLCIVSPPGLYQGEKPKRSIHAADAAWFFSLKDGTLLFSKSSPILLKSVPAGSPVCADLVRRRILVFSGYLNCVEEYSIPNHISEARMEVVTAHQEILPVVGEHIYAFMQEASDQRYAWRAFKRPWQGLQEWISQLQQEGVSGTAAYARDNGKTDQGAAKARTRRIKKLRLRMDEFEKLGRSGERGYFVPYCVDFSDCGLRGLLSALNRATRDVEVFGDDAILRLRRISGIWRGFLGDCIASDVVLQTPADWSQDVQHAMSGLQKIVFGNIGGPTNSFFQHPVASQVVSACQDVLLWGIDVGLFEGLDRCDILIDCLRDLLDDTSSSTSLPANYFELMHDSLGEVYPQSSRDCSIAFIRRVLTLNVEATDGGIAGIVYERCQVEDLITLLFKLSIREFDAKIECPPGQKVAEVHAYTPVEKGLLALFNGCAIDLLASADVVTSFTPPRRRLSSIVAEESMFHIFATTCLRTCEELVTFANAEADDAGLSRSVCGKLLPLVLAMICNGGRGTLTTLKDSLLRLSTLFAAPSNELEDVSLDCSRFLPPVKSVESSHPYSRSQGAVRKVVRIPGATCLHIDFDPRCSTSGEADFVFVTPGHAWFHSDRVPFGENGIGDAGGCFFGGRESGNWPQSGRGISVWGDTATIMLCSTSQDRQGTLSAEEESRRWGLKCVVRGVKLRKDSSWRSDALIATEHALGTLVQRQMSLCDRTQDAPLLSKAEPLLRTLRGLESSTCGERGRLVSEIMAANPENRSSDGASLLERYESTRSNGRGQSAGARTPPAWKDALQVMLATVVASTKGSETSIMSQDSVAFQSILRTMARVEQWMVRRVQLLKEWSFLQDDDIPMTQLVERLSTDAIRLKEMCNLKDVPFFESDLKRSATDLYGVLSTERASGVALRTTDYREEVAHEMIEKGHYALQCAAHTSLNAMVRGRDETDSTSPAILHFLTSTVSAVEVRLADECLSGALRHAMDSIQLVQETKSRVDVPMALSSTTTGMFGSCWNEHTAERLSLAHWPDSVNSSKLISSWASETCHNLRNPNLSYSVRVAAIADFLAAYSQFRSHLSDSALQQYVAAVSDLLLDLERLGAESEPSNQAPEDLFIEDLVWIGYRYGIDTMFMDGDAKGAVSALREMVGRLLSMPARRSETIHSLQWKSLARVMRIAGSHVQSISQSPVAAMAWVELCTTQVLHRDFATSVHVQVASLRTVFAMAQISRTTVKPSIAAVMLEHADLIGQLLERIGMLQSTVKFTSDETENKLKDCGVVLLENEKSKLKIVDALEAIDSDSSDSVCLPTTLSRLDLSETPPQVPLPSGENAEADIEHRNVRCDGCSQSPIRGFRFKCFTCANYDLCGTCYANQSMHSLDHQFVRLARSSGAGELLQPRSKANGAAIPEATLVGSKQWMGSVLRAALDAYGYSVLCRGSSEDCLRKAKALSAAGFAVTVMEWPDVKDLEEFYDWNSSVHVTLEPGSARLSRRSSTANASTASRRMDRSVVSQFNRTLRTRTRRHELRDARSLLAELVGFTRYLMGQEEVLVQTGPLMAEIIDALKGLGTQVPLSSIAERALFHRTLGLTNVLGGFVPTLRQGARVKSSDPEASKHRTGIVKHHTDASESVIVMWCSQRGLSDDEDFDQGSKHSLLQLEVVDEVEVASVPQEVFTSTSFFPAFAAALKAAHKLLKSTPLELAQNEGHVAATELVVSWLRMFMASMEKLPSLLDSRASPGNGSGNMALLLFQLAKTSKSCGSFESLDASRSVLWHAQQVVLNDCQFKLASRPITTAEVRQNAASIFGPGANGVTDLTEYVFNLYAHSSRSELPKHSGRNKLLEYWEKNVIPAIEAYVAGSFKSYEMDYFFAQLREPLREGNQAAAMKIAFTLCDGHVPSGCHYPDPDTDWSALQLDDIEVGARYLVADGSATSDQADWPMEMRWTVGHSGVVRTMCPNGLILMQLWNPRTACLEHWWYSVDNLAACSSGSSFSERSVDNYESTLADLLKLDMELLGAIARKCVFSMLRHSPEQFPLVSDRQAAAKTHFNIVDILRMAGGAELGCEAKTLVGEAEVGRSPLTDGELAERPPTTYDLMDSLRFVLTKRFEFVPTVMEDVSTTGEMKPLSPMNQANKTKLAKSGKTPGGVILSPQKSPQGLAAPSSFGLAVVKYRYTLIEALVQELKRSLDSSALFSQQSAFTVVSDSPPKPLIMLKVPGASCLVISFAVHPVLMDLPAGSSLEFFRDERCTKRIFGFFGDKRGLNFLPPLVVAGDSCFVRASQASYARYKFRVDPLTSDFGLAMWIGNELYQRMLSVTLSGFELESIVSSALNAITDYLTNGVALLPPCTKGVVCQLLTKMINFAINRSMSNSVPLSKLSALTREFAVAYDHELSAQKGLFSLPTQQLGELLATVEEVARLRGTTSISLSTTWWPNLVRFATFTRALTHKRDTWSSTDILARVSSGRTPVEAIDEAAKLLQDRDLLCERMVLLQKLPQTKRIPELEAALSRFIQHLALEECGEADDQTVLSATEVVRFGVLGKVVHLPVDANGDTIGYAVVDVGRHDIIPRLLLRLQKEGFEFDGTPTEEDGELADKLSGQAASVSAEAESEVGDGVVSPCDDSVWSCGVCTLENPASEVECAACGSPMPSEAVGRRQRNQSMRSRNGPNQDQGGATGGHTASGAAESSPGWQCEACTLVNPWATLECGACGSERNPSLVEPAHSSTGEPGKSVDGDAPGAKSVLHTLSGFSLADLLKAPATQNVRQVATFLIEQFTREGSGLTAKLAKLVKEEVASISTPSSNDGYAFVRMVAKYCSVENISGVGWDQMCAKLLEVTTKEPIKVYEWLRVSGFDLSAETNHYVALEVARASQAKWTHNMDVQLVVLARQVGSGIGVLSLMDLCPSHLCSSHVAEGSILSGLESRDLRLRFLLLKTFNKMTLDVLPMVNLRNLTDPNAFRTRAVALRQLLFPAVKIRFFAETQDNANLAQSNLMDATVKRPVVTLDRRQINAARLPGEPLSLSDPKKSLFAATMAQLSQAKPSILRAKRPTGASDPFVAFIVVFAGENVVGEGGPYRQLFNDIATELLSQGNPLFLPTQNSVMKIGEYRDRFLPNPSATTRSMLKMYEFVGVLMGCCIRTGVHLNIRLAPIIWKLLVKQSLLTMVDLEHIDFSVCESLKFIEAAAAAENGEPGSGDAEVFFDSFTTALSDGTIVELKPSGSNVPVTKLNCKEYVSIVMAARFQECKPQVDAMLRGIGTIVPIHLLQLCTWVELQQWVCGSLAVDVDLLKRHTLYSSGMTPEKFPHLDMFWRVLRGFSEENKRRFINFAWGQDTLPADDAEFDRTHTRLLIKAPPVTTANQDALLPKADTCFFNIELPAYSSEDIMREKLKLAITMCTSMDGDEQTGRMDLYFSTDAMDDEHME